MLCGTAVCSTAKASETTCLDPIELYDNGIVEGSVERNVIVVGTDGVSKWPPRNSSP